MTWVPRLLRLRRRPLWLSVVVIVLSFYLMRLTWDDFRYFLKPRKALRLGPVAQALKHRAFAHNSFVRIEGTADRRAALVLKGKTHGYDALVRLSESGERVFVLRHRDQRAGSREIHSAHEGRLMRFDALSFAAAARDFLGQRTQVEHDISLSELRRARSLAATTIKDSKGRLLSLEDQTLFEINVRYRDEWVLQVSKSVYRKASEAAAALRSLAVPLIAEPDDSPTFWRFATVLRAEEVRKVLHAIAQPELAAGLVTRQISYSVPWAKVKTVGEEVQIDLSGSTTYSRRYLRVDRSRSTQGASESAVVEAAKPAESDEILVADERMPIRIAPSAVAFISIQTPYRVPDNAMVVRVGDRPDDHWHYALLFGILGLFIVINLRMMLRALRAQPPAD